MSETFETVSIENIMAEIETLLVVDPNDRNLDQISLRIGRSFMVCQRHYVREGAYLESLLGQLKKLEVYLRRYYGGELPPQVYKEKPLPVKPLKSEVDFWVKSNNDFIELSSIVFNQRAKIKFIEASIDRLNKTGYEVKNAIEWRKYIDGV